MNAVKTKTYYLVIESFESIHNEFEIIEVEATTVKTAVEEYLEIDDDYIIDKELTIDKDKGLYKAGFYAGEEHTIGIAITRGEAALQYIYARIECG